MLPKSTTSFIELIPGDLAGLLLGFSLGMDWKRGGDYGYVSVFRIIMAFTPFGQGQGIDFACLARDRI